MTTFKIALLTGQPAAPRRLLRPFAALRRLFRGTVPVMLATALAAGSAAAAGPVPLGTFSDWRAFKLEGGSNTICYALSEPKESQPRNVRRGKTYVMIANWPGRKVRHEVSVVAGYPYRDGSEVTLNVDGTRYKLFTQNDSRKEGGAWVADRAVEARLVNAMKRGNSLIVTGTSSRGTLTTDTYSLAGVTAAIKAIDKACP